MSAPAKFLFDTDFSAPSKTRERAATPAEIAQQLAAAEARAFRDGYDAGRQEAKAESDRRTALALEEISIALSAIATGFSAMERPWKTKRVAVAVRGGAKIGRPLRGGRPRAEGPARA